MMKEQLQNVQVRIDNLLLMQGQASSQEALKLVMKTFESLSKEKTDLENRLVRVSSGAKQEEAIKESVQIIQDNLREFERAYRKAKGSMKKRLLRKLLKQVVLSPEGLHIFMQLADGVEIPNHQIKLIRFEGSKDEKNPQYALTRKASGDDSNLQVFNSVIGKLGDLPPSITELGQVTVFIKIPDLCRVRIKDNLIELYSKGLSLRDIALHTRASKTFIRKKLLEAGIRLRESHAVPTNKHKGKLGKQCARPYYGFCYLNGQVVMDTREYQNLLLIHSLWTSGMNSNRIATYLNAKKIRSRSNKDWSWNAVKNIIDRFESKKIIIKGGKYEFR